MKKSLDPSKIIFEFTFSNGEKVEISPYDLMAVGVPFQETYKNGEYDGEEDGELTGAFYNEE